MRRRTALAGLAAALVLVAGCGQGDPDPEAARAAAVTFVTALQERDSAGLADVAVRESGVSADEQRRRLEQEVSRFGGTADPSSVDVVVGDVSPRAASLSFVAGGQQQRRTMEWIDGAWRVALAP